MRRDFELAAKKGTSVKNQIYKTERGTYQLLFVRYKHDIYMFKHLNGKLVECCNLSRAPEIPNAMSVNVEGMEFDVETN